MKISKASIAASIGGVVGVALGSLLFPQESRLSVILGAFIGAIVAALLFGEDQP
jgi:uncharacterized protein YqgC (DUF456 family)